MPIHGNLIISAYVTTPFDKPVLGTVNSFDKLRMNGVEGLRTIGIEGLRVTGHGEPVEPCDGYSLGNDSHAQLFMTVCIKHGD